jgi:hypothetical protein
MKTTAQQYKLALGLSIFTIVYNTLEGVVSVFMGAHDETLTLFGFGLDSIIEVISGVGIFIMIRRIQRKVESSKSKGEITALKITGYSFYGLIALLVISSVLAIVTHHHPATTIWGAMRAMHRLFVAGVTVPVRKRPGHR